MIKDYKIPLLFKTGTINDITLWYTHKNPICDVCKGFFNNDFNAGFIVDWTKEGVNHHLLHLDCIGKWVKHPLSVTQYRMKVLISDVIPPKATPVIIQAPSFSPSRSNVTVFEPDKLCSDKTKDDAWRSKRFPSLDGATIGSSDALEKIEARDREDQALLEADPACFLDELKKGGQKAISVHNKDLLGGGD